MAAEKLRESALHPAWDRSKNFSSRPISVKQSERDRRKLHLPTMG